MLEQSDHTTSLLEVRRFLESEEAAPSPWAEPRESLDSLYALLVARRDDAPFWSRLEDLILRLEDRRVDIARLGNSEALGYATVSRLLADLRADLHENDGSASLPWKRLLSSSLRATSLAAFLLLGTASASCGDDDSNGPCSEADENGVTGYDADVYCDLVDIINGSDLSSYEKAGLLDCLPELDAAYREELLEAFQSMDEATIAEMLSAVLDGVCYDDTDAH